MIIVDIYVIFLLNLNFYLYYKQSNLKMIFFLWIFFKRRGFLHRLNYKSLFFQIYDYMSCLPGHKVPRISTPGEKARERQLMLQLPKQDLALAYTRHVEPEHHTSFRDFVAARNDIALDIGIVKLNIPQSTVSISHILFIIYKIYLI